MHSCFFNIFQWIIIKLGGNVCLLNPLAKFNNQPVCGYNVLPKFVNQLIASSTQIIQIDSRHLLFYYRPISLVYYYTGVFCDIWVLLLYLLAFFLDKTGFWYWFCLQICPCLIVVVYFVSLRFGVHFHTCSFCFTSVLLF